MSLLFVAKFCYNHRRYTRGLDIWICHTDGEAMDRKHLLIVVDLDESLSADQFIKYLQPLMNIKDIHFKLVCRLPIFPTTYYQLPSFAEFAVHFEKRAITTVKTLGNQLKIDDKHCYLCQGKHNHDIQKLAKLLDVQGIVNISRQDKKTISVAYNQPKLPESTVMFEKVKRWLHLGSQIKADTYLNIMKCN